MNKLVLTAALVSLGITNLKCAQKDQAKAPARVSHSAVSNTAADHSEGLIKLDVLVLDPHGKPVSGLKSADFTLLEAGCTQTILSFQAFSGWGSGSEPPVKVILLIDTLDLVGNLAAEECSAAETYLREYDGRLTHPVSVYLLDHSGLRVAEPSSDGRTLAAEIEHNQAALVRPNERRRTFGGGGEIGVLGPPDPPYLPGLKALGQIATYERTKPGRKLLIWVGPGGGIGSGKYNLYSKELQRNFYTVCWFSSLLREARLALYSFSVGQPSGETFASSAGGSGEIPSSPHPGALAYLAYLNGVRSAKQAELLAVYRRVLAVQSGGGIMVPRSDLVGQIKSCIEKAGAYYRISFDPFSPEHSDEYHDLILLCYKKSRRQQGHLGRERARCAAIC